MTINDIKEKLAMHLGTSEKPVTIRWVNKKIEEFIQDFGLLGYNRDSIIFSFAQHVGIKVTKFVPDELKREVGEIVRLVKNQSKTQPKVVIQSTNTIPPKKFTKSSPESKTKYLDIKILPDNFYIKLQQQINDTYNCKIFVALEILIRKFMENLVIDILRKRYGDRPPGLDIYYNRGKNKFHDFNFQLKTLEEKIKLDDFTGSPISDVSFLRKIAKYKDKANKTAHTLEIDKSKDEVDADKNNVQNIIEILIRALNIIQ